MWGREQNAVAQYFQNEVPWSPVDFCGKVGSSPHTAGLCFFKKLFNFFSFFRCAAAIHFLCIHIALSVCRAEDSGDFPQHQKIAVSMHPTIFIYLHLITHFSGQKKVARCLKRKDRVLHTKKLKRPSGMENETTQISSKLPTIPMLG